MDSTEIANKILSALEKQKFNDWYSTGDFDDYIRGEECAPTKNEILKDIKLLFNLQ